MTEKQKEILTNMYEDPLLFSLTVLSAHFYKEPGQIHKEIFKQIPEIIYALIDAIPYFIEAFVEAAPKMSVGLANKLSDPNFLAKFAANVAAALVKSVATIPQTLINGLKNNKILSETIKALFDVGKYIVQSIEAGLEGIGNFFEKIFQFDGGGRGAVEQFLGFDFPWIAFAKGGRVPGGARTNGDSALNDIVPALLSPGEIVLPRSAIAAGPMGIANFLKEIGVKLPGMAKGGVFGKKGFFNDVFEGVSDFFGDVVDTAVGVVDTAIPGDLTGIYESLKKFVSDIDIGQFIENPLKETERIIRSIASVFQPQFRQMMKGPGMSNGGMIRSVRGGLAGMDSVNARLMPGELVVDRTTTDRLDKFLSNKSNSDDLAITNALLSKIIQLLSKEQTVESEITINREAFANIILTLSRNNQRLSA